jgi:hypothetical protein
VIKIEQHDLAQRAESRDTVPLGVYGEAIAVNAQWNEQLAGSMLPGRRPHVRLATQMEPNWNRFGAVFLPQNHELSLNSEGEPIGG